MKRRAALAATLVFVVAALAYSRPETIVSPDLKIKVESKNPWTHLGLQNRPENFQFAIVTDRTGGHREGVFESAVSKLNLMQPEFVMSVGDLIEGGTNSGMSPDEQWKQFNQFVGRLEMPFFFVPGNHDLRDTSSISLWQNQFGRTHFHFVYHDVLFVTLNTEDPPATSSTKYGNIGDEQLDWLEKVLRENSQVNWTIVFLHKPMWQYGPMANWDRVEKILGDRPRTVFAGHHHRYAVAKVGKYNYYALATTGGASKLLGPEEGSFDHVVWVTMTPKGPKLANLLLDGILTDDPMTEARAKLPKKEPKPSAKAGAK
ncbi:MAG TPA: metallophosphoesterase [Pirellulales bacterium]|jgi:3',5'-cyclic AMP phosphodiesterase CpdA|nr:metallophosphoesterase [Pirellulales bacterium]